MSVEAESIILTGDCGGTNTRLKLSGMKSDGNIFFEHQHSYKNKDFISFVEIVREFLSTQDCHPTVAVLGCAGPVIKNCINYTNTAWEISGHELAKELKIDTVKLINDFAAMGYGLLTLKDYEFIQLNDAKMDLSCPIAAIGAGTGLGECFLAPNSNNNEYECFPSEGGHTNFSPSNDIEYELMQHLEKELGCRWNLSVERVVSGRGLGALYGLLCCKFPSKVCTSVHDEWLKAGIDKGAIVGKYANEDQLCAQALKIFIGAYGREAGNMALKYLPYGGLYITAAVSAKNSKFFVENKATFMNAFLDKGRVSEALRSVPVYLVLEESIGERGAVYYARRMLRYANTDV